MPIIIVTGSSGHLGEALLRVMRQRKINAVGIDVLPSEGFTTHVGSIADKEFITSIFTKYEMEEGIQGIINTAVLHKPHIVSHSMQDFVNVNITGTLNLLERFSEICCNKKTTTASTKIPFENRFFIQTSTTSTYGDSLVSRDKSTITWIDESVAPSPKNIYGVTKKSAEEICELFAKQQKISHVFVLQASRFFPEEDDDGERASLFASDNHQQFVELFHRRVEIEDLVEVHLLAAQKAMTTTSNQKCIFKRYICSSPSPFTKDHLQLLATMPANQVIAQIYSELWPKFIEAVPSFGEKDIPIGIIDRVYCSQAAVAELNWKAKFDAESVMRRFIEKKEKEGKLDENNLNWKSELAEVIGKKGYHRGNME